MNRLISYAQNFEDVMLWRALGHVENGRYVDVGAQMPDVDSVSRLFYDRGWRGVHVEPMPQYADALRRERPGDSVVQAVLGSEPGIVPFYALSGTGLSTIDQDIAEGHARSGFGVEHEVAVGSTLDEVFARFPAGEDVHWLKIDVEGAEKQVLEGWRSDSVLPWIVVIESTLPLSQIESYDTWEPLVLSKGYEFAYFDGLNRFYIAPGHAELRESFKTGPNIFDGFALSGMASSTFCDVVNEQKEILHEALAQAAATASNQLAEAREWAEAQQRQHDEEQVVTGAKLEQAMHRIAELSEKLSDANARELSEAERLSALQAAVDQREHELGAIRAELGARVVELSGRLGAAESLAQERAATISSLQQLADSLTERMRDLGSMLESAIRQSQGLVGELEAQRELRALHVAESAELQARHAADIAKLDEEMLAMRESFERERGINEALVARLRGMIALREAGLDEAQAELARQRHESYRWWVEAEGLRRERDVMAGSKSWRLTAPLRAVHPALDSWRSRTKRQIRAALVWGMRRAASKPVLAFPARAALRMIPSAKLHLLALARLEGVIDAAPAQDTAEPKRVDGVAGASQRAVVVLGPRETRVLEELRQAIEGTNT